MYPLRLGAFVLPLRPTLVLLYLLGWLRRCHCAAAGALQPKLVDAAAPAAAAAHAEGPFAAASALPPATAVHPLCVGCHWCHLRGAGTQVSPCGAGTGCSASVPCNSEHCAQVIQYRRWQHTGSCCTGTPAISRRCKAGSSSQMLVKSARIDKSRALLSGQTRQATQCMPAPVYGSWPRAPVK